MKMALKIIGAVMIFLCIIVGMLYHENLLVALAIMCSGVLSGIFFMALGRIVELLEGMQPKKAEYPAMNNISLNNPQ